MFELIWSATSPKLKGCGAEIKHKRIHARIPSGIRLASGSNGQLFRPRTRHASTKNYAVEAASFQN